MGLDMYAYSAAYSGQYKLYWENFEKGDNSVSKPLDIMYWRKHPNLQGWMENLWVEKGRPGHMGDWLEDFEGNRYQEFNNIELELTWEDLDKLEEDIKNKKLPHTVGFFYGENSDEYYYDKDLSFIKAAKADLFMGLKVFYSSSW